MSLVAEAGTNYEKPDSGEYNAVLADVVDLGMVSTIFNGETKTQPKVRFVWVLNPEKPAAVGKDGKPMWVTQRYTLSLHEKATLSKHIQMICGSVPQKLDLETLVGIQRKLFVMRETKNDKLYANIMAILPTDVVTPIPPDFVRHKNKPQTQTYTTYTQQSQTRPLQSAQPAMSAADMQMFAAWQRAQQQQPAPLVPPAIIPKPDVSFEMPAAKTVGF